MHKHVCFNYSVIVRDAIYISVALSSPRLGLGLLSAGREVGVQEAEGIANDSWCTSELSPVASSAERGKEMDIIPYY